MTKTAIRNLHSDKPIPPRFCDVVIEDGKIFLEKKTDKTITDIDEMMQVLEEVRKNGYALDDEENEEGVRCIAACLHGYSKEVKYAFSISGPVSRMTRERVEELAVDVKKVQEELSRELGYYPQN